MLLAFTKLYTITEQLPSLSQTSKLGNAIRELKTLLKTNQTSQTASQQPQQIKHQKQKHNQ